MKIANIHFFHKGNNNTKPNFHFGFQYLFEKLLNYKYIKLCVLLQFRKKYNENY